MLELEYINKDIFKFRNSFDSHNPLIALTADNVTDALTAADVTDAASAIESLSLTYTPKHVSIGRQ